MEKEVVNEKKDQLPRIRIIESFSRQMTDRDNYRGFSKRTIRGEDGLIIFEMDASPPTSFKTTDMYATELISLFKKNSCV